MVTPEAHASSLRAEGTSDILARPSSSVLRVPLPVASNMVPFIRSPRPCVSTHCLLGFLECAASYITSSLTDWFFFLVLDIGTPAIEAIPLHRRVLLGLLQAVAVRAAGFAAVPLAALAPGVT
jgi:Trk-type K+ transport system membrane component